MPVNHAAPTQGWIAEFIQQNGRPPRILHMGNVCNNAYQTAKMLNAAGADCDVYNADDYTIMTTPEWDDADISGDWGSLYYPLLHRVNLNGFERPRWVAQGPMVLVIQYLTAKRQGKIAKANRLWRKLERTRHNIADRENGIPQTTLSALGDFLSSLPRLVIASSQKFFSYCISILHEMLAHPAFFLARLGQKLGSIPPEKAEALAQYDEAIREKKRAAMLSRIIDYDVLRRVETDAKTLFPDREICFDTHLESYMLHLKELRQLFSFYDIIHAYADQAPLPYLAGVKYVAYEHGTLRNYVYQPNDLSRLTLLAFARARVIYITNIDCYDSAQYIAAANKVPIICGLHGIDVQRIIHKINVARPSEDFDGRFGVPEKTPLFFSPSRHTWLKKEGRFLKGDEKVVGAAARLAAEGYSFVLVLSAWGDDIEKLKEIIARHPQLDGIIRWHRPLGKAEFYTVLRSADAVLDQFYLHAYGAIAIEALSANAAALITCSIEPQRLARFFSQPMPYLSADSEDDIYHAMKRVLVHPQETQALARQGQAWVEHCHSGTNIIEKCCQAYEIVLPTAQRYPAQ